MRKFTLLFLTLTLCVLPLFSCEAGLTEDQEEAIDLYEKYDHIIDALEDKEYEEAINEINKLNDKEQGGNNDTENNNNNGGIADDTSNGNNGDTTDTEAVVDPEVEALKAQFPGEWIYEDYEADEMDTFVVRADGTCTIKGKDYTWTYSEDISKTHGKIDVTDGREGEYAPYYISYSFDGNNELRASVYERTSEYSGTAVTSSSYNLDNYTVVELTLDNLYDYFELVEYVRFEENVFGEIEAMYLNNYLSLKDEYLGGIRTSISDAAVEVTKSYDYINVTVDVDSCTYELGEIQHSSDPYTDIANISSMNWDDNEEGRYGFQLGGGGTSVPTGQMVYYKNFEFKRVIGTLYIYNK